MAVKPIPEGYHSVTPYLCVKGAAQAIRILQKGSFGHRTDAHIAPQRQSRPRRGPNRRLRDHAVR
jgi:hypothetical protein